MKKQSMKGSDDRRIGALGAGLLGMVVLASACGTRSEEWESNLSRLEPISLSGSVAIQDKELGKLVFVTAPQAGELETQAFELGEQTTAIVPSIGRDRLFALSSGVTPRIEEEDEGPELRVFSGSSKPELLKKFKLDDPMGQLALDPEGQWVVAFSGNASVYNPNELVFLSLEEEDAEPFSKTIRSFGGSPLEVVFTELLEVPGGAARRFLVVRTDRDVALLDLSELKRKKETNEITIKLPQKDGVPYRPVQIVVDDGDPDDSTDARIGVRLQGTSDVLFVQLNDPIKEDRDFSISPNIVDVGGVPSAIDFVRTDGGLRLAALVPDRKRATLINPATTFSEVVELGGSYSQMTRITDVTSELPEGGDVALLWGSDRSFAFWSLGSTSGTPYRSIDATELDIDLKQVLNVPAPNQHLKVLLGTSATKFYVLDLKKRQSAPLLTQGSGYQVQIAPDGGRLWAYRAGHSEFSSVRFSDLHPTSLYVRPSVAAIADIERGDGGRATLVFHDSQGWSATWFDSEKPSSTSSQYFPALHWENVQ